MANDSGKHSALRQTGEGSFELVTDEEGLQEISESEASFAEETPQTRTSESSAGSSRIPFLAVAVVAAVAIAIAIGWAMLGSSDNDSAADEPDEPMGFKPYAGGSEEQPTRTPDPTPVVAERDQPDEEADPSDDEAIEEEDPGWELSEDGIVVEDEGEPDPEEVEEITEDEEIPPEVLAEGEELENTPRIQDQQRLETIRKIGERIPSPNAPSIGKTPSIYGNVRKPKLRRIDPSTGTLKKVEPEAMEEGGGPATNGANY